MGPSVRFYSFWQPRFQSEALLSRSRERASPRYVPLRRARSSPVIKFCERFASHLSSLSLSPWRNSLCEIGKRAEARNSDFGHQFRAEIRAVDIMLDRRAARPTVVREIPDFRDSACRVVITPASPREFDTLSGFPNWSPSFTQLELSGPKCFVPCKNCAGDNCQVDVPLNFSWWAWLLYFPRTRQLGLVFWSSVPRILLTSLSYYGWNNVLTWSLLSRDLRNNSTKSLEHGQLLVWYRPCNKLNYSYYNHLLLTKCCWRTNYRTFIASFKA